MKDAYRMVSEFHRAFGHTAPAEPCIPSDEVLHLRHSLILEELCEYRQAAFEGDAVAIADALADLAYVVIGTAVAHGLTQFDEIFAEVHRANLCKTWPDGKVRYRDDGKVMKPPGWTSPNIERFLK
jgi:predicted HAD superfamily Cof-like phosphohydrolase